MRALLVVTGALVLAACSPIRIKLEYGTRPPSAEHVGRVAFGTIDDQRRNTREVGPDVTLVDSSLTVPQTMESIVREGLAAAGFEVVETARFRVDAHLHAAWAQATFYRVQANLQVTVEVVDTASGQTVWSHRFGTVEASGGSDARANYQAAYKRALSRLAEEVAEAFSVGTFAEAMESGGEDGDQSQPSSSSDADRPTVSPESPLPDSAAQSRSTAM